MLALEDRDLHMSWNNMSACSLPVYPAWRMSCGATRIGITSVQDVLGTAVSETRAKPAVPSMIHGIAGIMSYRVQYILNECH